MKIAYKHLLNFLKNNPSIEDVSDKLFQLGHEHEIENSSIFDIEFTPNRGDCLSLIGLARDLNVFYESDLSLKSYTEEIPSLNLDFTNKSKRECPEISFLNIQIKGSILNYKDYLENYFQDLKINKNNFFTDVSNYLAYEMGQPTHAYDFTKITGNITLQKNYNDYNFSTLVDKDITLNSSDLVFINQDQVINLAGIMGGKDSACSNQTNNTLIECAYFKPESILGKSIKYDIQSDASYKFVRGVDPFCHEDVLRRFIQIVDDHAEITKLEIYKNGKNKYKPVKLDIDLARVNQILGININMQQYKNCLLKLGFGFDKKISIPSYRSDITHQNDLCEEIARVIGYNNIPVQELTIKKSKHGSIIPKEQQIKSFLIDNGFFEVVNSTFTKIDSKNTIKVDKPLDNNRKFIRTDITSSLIQNVIYNEKRQQDSIKLFEISDIYSSDTTIKKVKKLGLIVSGRKGNNHIDFSLKLNEKYIYNLMNEIGINVLDYVTNIRRETIDSKIQTPIYALEIDLNEIPDEVNLYTPRTQKLEEFVQYKPISEFPSSYRDISFSLLSKKKLEELNRILTQLELINLKDSFMFDLYDDLKKNEIKAGFRFIFQSHVSTLTDLEINIEIEKIVLLIQGIDGIDIPGL